MQDPAVEMSDWVRSRFAYHGRARDWFAEGDCQSHQALVQCCDLSVVGSEQIQLRSRSPFGYLPCDRGLHTIHLGAGRRGGLLQRACANLLFDLKVTVEGRHTNWCCYCNCKPATEHQCPNSGRSPGRVLTKLPLQCTFVVALVSRSNSRT